jgi:hypothetical protein
MRKNDYSIYANSTITRKSSGHNYPKVSPLDSKAVRAEQLCDFSRGYKKPPIVRTSPLKIQEILRYLYHDCVREPESHKLEIKLQPSK